MKIVGIVALLFTALLSSQAGDTNGNWRVLFNGRDLTGWTAHNQPEFTVTNSFLRLAGGQGWLRNTEVCSNFVLTLEWRALQPGYDSGIFIRAGTNGVPWPTGAWQVNLSRTSLGALVKGYRTMVPAETAPIPLNTWVKFEISVEGSRVQLDVDGEKAWEYHELDAPAGHIGIQAEGKAFEFRNIRLLKMSGAD